MSEVPTTIPGDMTASRIAWYGAVATSVVWAAKAVAIWEAGGLNKTSLEDVGWSLGVLLFLATWGALGYAFADRRAAWLRIVAGVVGVVIGLGVVLVLDSAADVLPDSTGWVKEEAGLWAAAVVTLVLAWIQRRRSYAEREGGDGGASG